MDKFARMMLFCAIFANILQYIGAQTVHTVGDGIGWDIPPNSSVSYVNWASGKTFRIGDTLVFNFRTNQHDVLRVPRSAYDACSDNNGIGNIITTGPTTITLDSAGEHYYICTIGSHCEAGQKLAITVSGGTPGATPPTSSPPATPTTPSPTSNQPDACAPTPSSSTPNVGGPPGIAPSAGTPPPPDSSSRMVLASFLPVLVSIGVALFI